MIGRAVRRTSTGQTGTDNVCVVRSRGLYRHGHCRGVHGHNRLYQGLNSRGRRGPPFLQGYYGRLFRPVDRLAPTGEVGLWVPTEVSSVVAPAPPFELSVLQVPGNLGVSGEQGGTGTTAKCRGLPSNTTDDTVRAPAVSSAAAHRKSSPRGNSDLLSSRVPPVMGEVVETEIGDRAGLGKGGCDEVRRAAMTDGTPTMPKTGKRGPTPGPMTVVV